jgi:hypothetical protein
MQMTFFIGVFVGLAVGLSAARFLIWPPRDEPDLDFYEPPAPAPTLTATRPMGLTYRNHNHNRSVET